MLDNPERNNTINFINSLQNKNGGFPDKFNLDATPQTTLSGIKSLLYLGKTANNPDRIFNHIIKLYNNDYNAFTNPENGTPNVFLSAAGLLILYNIGAYSEFNKIADKTLDYMSKNAKIREEHFMTIGVVDECNVDFNLSKSIDFFNKMFFNGTFGESPLNNAIASSALMRIGEKIHNPENLINNLLNAQTSHGGFADNNDEPDIWTTYCVMRALDLFSLTPNNILSLSDWIKSFYINSGGFGLTGESSLNATYQSLSIMDWITKPVFDAAKQGNIAPISKWIESGGSPDVYNTSGWTPLLVASAKGKSEVVKYLLSDKSGYEKANPEIKFSDADASPLFLSGQSGDLNTVKFLLKSSPERIFDISYVNGHNVLLQLAFYGSANHYNCAEWLLTNLGDILDISSEEESDTEKAMHRLMSMTNVRGYNCTTMNELWGNKRMGDLFTKFDTSTEKSRYDYHEKLLNTISIPPPDDHNELLSQQLTEEFIIIINDTFAKLNNSTEFKDIKEKIFLDLKRFIDIRDFNINRLGGPLGETPLITAVTGVDSNENIKIFREELVRFLLDNGADPDKEELHPMAVDAVIRSAVLNHFEILKIISEYMPPLAFAASLNCKPAINGQTALQDTVHRALTSSGESLKLHLKQIEWAISKGAKYNIEDHTGTSPQKLAMKTLNDETYKNNASEVLVALGINI